uniref:Uncharacterized protein n=1 Tax=Alexandrium catenella TaxID=2925 RepID=A0A7S1PQA2_ALECA
MLVEMLPELELRARRLRRRARDLSSFFLPLALPVLRGSSEAAFRLGLSLLEEPSREEPWPAMLHAGYGPRGPTPRARLRRPCGPRKGRSGGGGSPQVSEARRT